MNFTALNAIIWQIFVIQPSIRPQILQVSYARRPFTNPWQATATKQFAFPGNVTSDSHVNGSALGSSTAALVHWRPVRNCPSSASFAWESIEGPWTEHNISYKAFKPGLGPGWAREESRCEQTPSDRDSESSNGPCGSTDLVDGEDLTHQQLPRL